MPFETQPPTSARRRGGAGHTHHYPSHAPRLNGKCIQLDYLDSCPPSSRRVVSEYTLPAPSFATKVKHPFSNKPYYNHLGQLVYPDPLLHPAHSTPPIYLSSITKITTTTTTATRRASPQSPSIGGAAAGRSAGQTTSTTTTTTTSNTVAASASRPHSRLGSGSVRSPRVSPSPSSPHPQGRLSTQVTASQRSSSPPPVQPPQAPQRSGSTPHVDARLLQPPAPPITQQGDDDEEEDENFRQLDSDQDVDPEDAPGQGASGAPSSYVSTHFQQRTSTTGRGGQRSRSPSASRAISIRTTTVGPYDSHSRNVFDSGNDVLLSVGDKEIKANKLILAEKSPVFREMFIDCLIISDVDPEAFETMLSYMYGDEFIVSDEILSLCLLVADKYQVDGFTEALLDHFIDKVNSRNCLALLRGGSRLKDPDEYLERVLSHVDRAIDEVVLQEEWTELPRDILALVLARDGLRITELDLFQAVLEWARCESERNGLSAASGDNLRAVLGDCLALIRFPVMSQAAFVDFVLPELILTAAEINDVVQYFNKEASSEFFSMTIRAEARSPDYYAVYRTSALQDGYAYYTPRRVILNATVRLDRKVQIVGFDFPSNFLKKRCFLSLYMSPKDARGRSKWNLETSPATDTANTGRALVTGYKLLLDENVEYALKITCDLSPGEGFYAPSAPAFEPETIQLDVTSGRMTVDFTDEATLTLSIARQNLTMAIPSILIKPRHY